MQNLTILLQAIGGLGLFLLGMIVMTDGLRGIAGNTIRSAMMRFTRNPLSGTITGAVGTAILQSSSATIVAAVGFVGAGLLAFPSALGIVFGANIGTTVTGWIVALVGFKLQLGLLALPLVFVGALLHLFGRRRLAMFGYCIAGFGLIFTGISTMQESLSGLKDALSFEQFSGATWSGRVQLLLLGVVFTTITQSSSAGVAAVLTAVFTDLIDFQQAAALVVGMNIGTTFTVALATIGGSVNAKRTGFSHVIFNLIVSLAALFLIDPYTYAWERLAPGRLSLDPELAVVAFHTGFNAIGAAVFLPFTYPYADFIRRIIPATRPQFTDELDMRLLEQPSLALTALQQSVKGEFIALLRHVGGLLGDHPYARRYDLREVQEELDKTHAYADAIHPQTGAPEWQRLIYLMHTLDHMQRLHERCEEEEDRAVTARRSVPLKSQREALIATIGGMIADIADDRWPAAIQRADAVRRDIHEAVRHYRENVIAQMAGGELDITRGTEQLQALRWLRRVTRHVSRISRHFYDSLLAAGSPPES